MRFFVDSSITTPITEYLTNPKYQQVEYLESTGTQYIDTGIQNSSELSFYINFNINNTTYSGTTITHFYGSRNQDIVGGGNGTRLYNLSLEDDYFGNRIILDNNFQFDKYHIIEKNKNTVIYDGTTYTHTSVSEITTQQTVKAFGFTLAGGSSNSFNRKMRIKQFRISDNDIFICNFIPAIRKEDSKPGMYDKVSGQFFTNAGTGEFLYGNPVYSNTPRGYKECEYLESTGTQWIDTGVMSNNNIKVQTNIYPTVINRFIFGSRVSSATNAFGLFMHSNDNGSWYPFFSNAKSMIPGFTIDNDYTIEFSKDGLIVNGTLLQGPYDDIFTNALTMKLFAMDTNGTLDNRMFIGKMDYCKIYDNDTLVRDYVPVLREADNTPGMYDRVSNTFFTNKGTGTFTYKLKERQTEKVTRILYSGSKMRLVRNTTV